MLSFAIPFCRESSEDPVTIPTLTSMPYDPSASEREAAVTPQRRATEVPRVVPTVRPRMVAQEQCQEAKRKAREERVMVANA